MRGVRSAERNLYYERNRTRRRGLRALLRALVQRLSCGMTHARRQRQPAERPEQKRHTRTHADLPAPAQQTQTALRTATPAQQTPPQSALSLIARAGIAGAREGHRLGAQYLAARAASSDATAAEMGAAHIEATVQRLVYGPIARLFSHTRQRTYTPTRSHTRGDKQYKRQTKIYKADSESKPTESDQSTSTSTSSLLHIQPAQPREAQRQPLDRDTWRDTIDVFVTMRLVKNAREAQLLLDAIHAQAGDTPIDLIHRAQRHLGLRSPKTQTNPTAGA